jgi:hypothetical protein
MQDKDLFLPRAGFNSYSSIGRAEPWRLTDQPIFAIRQAIHMKMSLVIGLNGPQELVVCFRENPYARLRYHDCDGIYHRSTNLPEFYQHRLNLLFIGVSNFLAVLTHQRLRTTSEDQSITNGPH